VTAVIIRRCFPAQDDPVSTETHGVVKEKRINTCYIDLLFSGEVGMN